MNLKIVNEEEGISKAKWNGHEIPSSNLCGFL